MGIGIKELLIVLIIIILLFGTKKLKNIGADLGSAIKGFRKTMGEPEPNSAAAIEGTGAEAAFNDVTNEVKEKK